jgi:hypothetical protein
MYGRARQLAGLPRQTARPAARSRGDAPAERSAGVKNPAIRFMVEYLGAHREAGFDEVKAAAADSGFTIYPITYGNARRLAGLEKRAPRRSASPEGAFPPAEMRPSPAAAARARRAMLPDSGVADPSGRSGTLSMLDELGEMLERLERQRGQLRETLDGIARAASECLAQLDA